MRPWATKDIEGEHVIAAAGREYDAWRTWFIAKLNFASGDQQAGDGIDSVIDPLDMPFLYSLCCDLADGPDVHRVPMFAVERTTKIGVTHLAGSPVRSRERADSHKAACDEFYMDCKHRVVTGEFVYGEDAR